MVQDLAFAERDNIPPDRTHLGAPMKIPLNAFQRSYAQYRIAFLHDLLSQEVGQSLSRTALACAENQKKQAGIIDVICGLYLQDPDEMKRHFTGNLEAFAAQLFPIHRFGREGLVPQVMLNEAATESGGAFGYSFDFDDDVIRVLWLGERLANAVGKRATLKDVVAAIALDRESTEELSRYGIASGRALADFNEDVRTIVFHSTPHTGDDWPKEVEFDIDKQIDPPFTLEASTPSGPFQPLRSARVTLNGSEVVDLAWPNKPSATVEVNLQPKNKIEFELDGPVFGSMKLTIRGVRA
jgi:hypothetical protein